MFLNHEKRLYATKNSRNVLAKEQHPNSNEIFRACESDFRLSKNHI